MRNLYTILGVLGILTLGNILYLTSLKEINDLQRDILTKEATISKLKTIIDIQIPKLESDINILSHLHNKKNKILEKLGITLSYKQLENYIDY